MSQPIYIGNTTGISLLRLRDHFTDEFLDDATIEADLLTAAGAAVSGGSDLPITHVEDTTGARVEYFGSIPHTVTLTEGAEYIIRVTVTWEDAESDSVVASFDIPCTAMRRYV